MAEPENTPDLYDTDILIWSEEQAEFLRRRAANGSTGTIWRRRSQTWD